MRRSCIRPCLHMYERCTKKSMRHDDVDGIRRKKSMNEISLNINFFPRVLMNRNEDFFCLFSRARETWKKRKTCFMVEEIKQCSGINKRAKSSFSLISWSLNAITHWLHPPFRCPAWFMGTLEAPLISLDCALLSILNISLHNYPNNIFLNRRSP